MDKINFLVSYKYIDKSFRERFGSIPITYFKEGNDREVNVYIYEEIENHLLSLGINIHEPNLNIKSCFSINYIFQF